MTSVIKQKGDMLNVLVAKCRGAVAIVVLLCGSGCPDVLDVRLSAGGDVIKICYSFSGQIS